MLQPSAVVELLVRTCGLTQYSTVLNFPAGHGEFAAALRDRFPDLKHYAGVDPNHENVERCRAAIQSTHPTFRFHTAPSPPSPLDDALFDVAFASVSNPADLEPTLRELARLLAPRGRALLADGTPEPALRRAAAAAGLDLTPVAPPYYGLARILPPIPTPPGRKLEIGPGDTRIPGFETLNILPGPNTDHVGDAAKPLPFPDDTFSVIYASHILEHVPWYQTADALREWVRILAPGGLLEVWVPDAVKICQAFLDAELRGIDNTINDGWYRFNPEKDPCIWASGRIFTYGDGDGNPASPNWHRALFSPRRLLKALRDAGLVDVHQLDRSQVRGYDHLWINLGARGTKP